VFPAAASLPICSKIVVLNTTSVACTFDSTINQTIFGGEVVLISPAQSSWVNLSLCNYRADHVIPRDALSLSTTAVAQNDEVQ
jgi:hypothetical protein